MKTEFTLAFNEVLEEKQLPRDIILSAIESAMASAYRKSVNASSAQEVKVKVDLDSGNVQVFAEKEVSEMITDDRTEVTLAEALKVDPEIKIGDLIMVESTPENFGRVAAQTARQVIQQKIRDAERAAQFEFYGKQMGEIVSGVVQAINSKQATIGLDLKAEGTMLRKDMIPGERFRIHDRIRAYVYEVKDTPRGLQILMSRAHRNFLRRLLENEVPEIYHGIVEIRSIAREPGQRAKVAVSATQQGIDPVGACVGVRGVRIQTIVRELHDEKIDVIEWSNDAALYISKAISPARVAGVYLNTEGDDNKTAMVVVPEDQLSLAIGREGQNARLAAKLTGWRIDILSVTEATNKAIEKLRNNPSLEELAKTEAENIPKIEELLQKKTEGRALSLDDYTLLTRFVDRVERRGEADRKAEDAALQAKLQAVKESIPTKAFEIPILDVQLKEHILIILQEAGLDTLGDLLLQIELDSDAILAYNGIGPKAFEEIKNMAESINFEDKDEVSTENETVDEQIKQSDEDKQIEQGSVVTESVSTSDSGKHEESLDISDVQPSSDEIVKEPVEEINEEEFAFEDIFKVDKVQFDFGNVEEEELNEEGMPVDQTKKKKGKKKKGYTVEYDPDRDESFVKRKHRSGDDWEEW